jgi:hypothetical protein
MNVRHFFIAFVYYFYLIEIDKKKYICESPDVHLLERYLLKLKIFFADIKLWRLGDLHKNRDGKCILHLHKLSLSSLVEKKQYLIKLG